MWLKFSQIGINVGNALFVWKRAIETENDCFCQYSVFKCANSRNTVVNSKEFGDLSMELNSKLCKEVAFMQRVCLNQSLRHLEHNFSF